MSTIEKLDLLCDLETLSNEYNEGWLTPNQEAEFSLIYKAFKAKKLTASLKQKAAKLVKSVLTDKRVRNSRV